MANRDILKEAIADAKAVKETAIANAKIALEETFAPYLREKLAAKLAEMDTSDDGEEEMETEEVYEAEEAEYMDEEVMDETKKDEFDLDELLRELDDMDEVINDPRGQGSHGNVAPSSESDTDLMEGKEEEEEFDIEDMSEGDLKDFIEGVIADMVKDGELEAGHEGMGDEDEDEEEEVDLNELLREMSDENNFRDATTLAKAVVDEYGQELKSSEKLDERKALSYAKKMMEEAGMKPVTMKNLLNGFADEDWPSDYVTEVSRLLREMSDEIDYDDLDRSNDDAYEKAFNSMDEARKMKKEKDLKPNAYYEKHDAGNKASKFKRGLAKFKDSSSDAYYEKHEKMKEELEEAYSTIAKIKSEINEVNLLNSKLLYANKVFKSKNLTESQKVKVLAAFDKAASKKEAQLVYETVMENLGTLNTPKRPVTESIRGMASRVISGASNTKQPIIEVNSAFERMQKLAGIRK